MTAANATGLVVFVIVTAISVVVLLVDLWFVLTGRETITDRIKRHPWVGWALCGLILLGPVGLLVHFLT